MQRRIFILIILLTAACDAPSTSPETGFEFDCRHEGYTCGEGFECLTDNSGAYVCQPENTLNDATTSLDSGGGALDADMPAEMGPIDGGDSQNDSSPPPEEQPDLGPAESEATENIGEAGGLIEIPGQVTLAVPPGAIDSEQEIRVRVIETTAEDGLEKTTPTVQLLPEGLSFTKDVTLTLPFDLSSLPDPGLAPLQTIFLSTDEGWVVAHSQPHHEEELSHRPHAVVNSASDTLSISLNHFSTYVGGLDANVGRYHFETDQDNTPHALRTLRHPDGLDDGANGVDRPEDDIEYIVLHHTVGAGPLRGQFNAGRNAAARNAPTAQFYVGRNGVIAQVSESTGLIYHAGTPANGNSVGIEICNSAIEGYPLIQLLAVKRLVEALASRLEIPLRGRWTPLFGELPNIRVAPPAFIPDDATQPGVVPEAFDRVLSHREVDGHKWTTRAIFPQGGVPNTTHLAYSATHDGRFCVLNAGITGCNGNRQLVAAGDLFLSPIGGPAGVLFRPTTIQTLNTEITLTAQPVDGNGANTALANNITYRLDYEPESANDWGMDGPGAGQVGQPQLISGRRKHDPGGQGVAFRFPFDGLWALLSYDHPGIINTSGGDAYLTAVAGDGGSVTLSANHDFDAGHFDAAEQGYLDRMAPTGDEAVQPYSLVIPSGETRVLDSGEHDYLWIVVEGTLQLSGNTTLRAASGFYLGPSGAIVSRAVDGDNQGAIEGYDLTIDTLGEALIFGLIDASGRTANTEGEAPLAGGNGGDIIVRMLAGTPTLVPTIISRGGHADSWEGFAMPVNAGGAGGDVTILNDGGVIVLTGGPGENGTAPTLPSSYLPPPPAFSLGTPDVHRPAAGQRLPLTYSVFDRGIVTSGGIGPSHSGSGRFAGDGGIGGSGGDISISAGTIVPRHVFLWTGGGLETVWGTIVTNRGAVNTEGYTGGLGGSGATGGMNFPGGEGGRGGRAGDIRIEGQFTPTISLSDRDSIIGFNGSDPRNAGQNVNGNLDIYRGLIPMAGNDFETILLSITAVGGSGGYAGGSGQRYPGDYGERGENGRIEMPAF